MGDQNYDDLKVLYHGTSRKNLRAILTKGLNPALSTRAEEEEQDYRIEHGSKFAYPGHHYFVYLSHSPKVAQSFGPGGDYHYDRNPHNNVILQVCFHEAFLPLLITDRGEFVRCPFLIHPEFIKVYAKSRP